MAIESEIQQAGQVYEHLMPRIRIPDAVAGGAISPRRFVIIASDGDIEQAAFNEDKVAGVYAGDLALASGDTPVPVAWGPSIVIADAAIDEGQPLKVGGAGRATPFVDSDLAGTTIEDNVGLAFTNQPANDGMEVVSDNTADTTQTITAYYTRNGQGNTVYTETKTLNGTTQVVFTDTDIDLVLAVEKSAATTGTITFREASGNQTIITLAAATLSSGKIAVTAGQTRAYNAAPTAEADAATTKRVGIIGTDESDAVLRASIALTGAVPVAFPDTFKTVTFLLVGDLESARTVTVKVGAEDGPSLYVGHSLTAAAAQGDRILAFVLPNTAKSAYLTTGGAQTISGPKTFTGAVIRTGQEYQLSGPPKAGATAGWVVNAAANLSEATLPASQSASTLVVPVSGLKVGWTITGFKIEAQVESAGGTVTIDADLRKLTNVAADPTDASVGTITQVSVTADTKVEQAKAGLSEVVAADEWFYLLITATTAGSTDIRFLGATVTVTEA